MPNTTPNFGFEYPLATDNLSDGAQSIQDFATTADTTFVDLKGGTTGQYLTKTTNTDMDFSWVTLPTIPDGFPTAGSTYYTSTRQFMFHDDIDTEPITQNIPVYIPIFFGQTTTLDRIAIEVTSAQAATTVRLGIYDNDGTGGAPNTRIADFGTVSSATTGVKELTISQSVSGLVYLAYVYTGSLSSINLRCVKRSPVNSAGWNMLQFSSSNADQFSSNPAFWRQSGTSSTLPATATPTLSTTAPQLASIIIAVRSA